MTQKIMNLTPHSITLIIDEEKSMLFPSQGIARVNETSQQIADIEYTYDTEAFADNDEQNFITIHIPIFNKKFGKVENLPNTEKNTIYIVSALVAQAVPKREDVFIVNDTVRDESGQIIGCKSFAHI